MMRLYVNHMPNQANNLWRSKASDCLKTFENQNTESLKQLIAVIVPNGSGKSALMDAFGRLAYRRV